MGSKQLFSVVITAYNRAWCIERAIRSVIEQSVTGWEIVISDDGSTDDTAEKINEISANINRNILYVRSEENKGMFHAQMLGAEKASGKYIIFLDSDDELTADALRNFQSAIKIHEKENIFFQTMIDDYGHKKGVLPKLTEGKAEKAYAYRDMCRLFAIGDYLPCVGADTLRNSKYFNCVPRISAYTHNLWYNLFLDHNVIFSPAIGAIVHLDHNDRRTKNQSKRSDIWLEGVDYFIKHHGSAIRNYGGQLRKCYFDAAKFAYQTRNIKMSVLYLTAAIYFQIEFKINRLLKNSRGA